MDFLTLCALEYGEAEVCENLRMNMCSHDIFVFVTHTNLCSSGEIWPIQSSRTISASHIILLVFDFEFCLFLFIFVLLL